MGKTLIKILYGIDALLGVGFVVLFSLEFFGVSVMQPMKDSGFGVYILYAAIVLYVLFLFIPIIYWIARKAKRSTRKTVLKPLEKQVEKEADLLDVEPVEDAQFSEMIAPLPTPSVDAESPANATVSASVSSKNSFEYQTDLTAKNNNETYETQGKPLPEPQISVVQPESARTNPLPFQPIDTEENAEELDSVYEIPVEKLTEDREDQDRIDWEKASKMMDDELQTDDVFFTGIRTSDALDLDKEFIVKSQDEAVLPKKPPQKKPVLIQQEDDGDLEKFNRIEKMLDDLYSLIDPKENDDNE